MTLYNLARVTTTTTGQGAITLGPAVPSFLTFAEAGAQNGDTITYAIEDGPQREIGRGAYNGQMLTRSAVLRSTNNNQPLNLTGNAQVAISPAAEDIDSKLSLEGGDLQGPLKIHYAGTQIAIAYPGKRWWNVTVGPDGAFNIIDQSAGLWRFNINEQGAALINGPLSCNGDIAANGANVNAVNFNGTGSISGNQVLANGFHSYGGIYVTAGIDTGSLHSRGQCNSVDTMSAGSVGIRTPLGGPNAFAFHWNHTSVYMQVDGATGWMVVQGTSDERLKEDIAPTQFDCLAAVEKIPLYQFRWKATGQHVDIGIVAQRLEPIAPSLVVKPPEPPPPKDIAPRLPPPANYKQIDTNNALAMLIGAIQQLTTRVAVMEDAMRANRLIPKAKP